MKSVEKELKDMKKIVKDELEFDERGRNDDKYLIFCVLKRLGFSVNFTPYSVKLEVMNNDFHKLPSFETIRRVRAEIQNVDELFLPTDPKVLVKRRIREKLIKTYYSNDPNLINDWFNLKYSVK